MSTPSKNSYSFDNGKINYKSLVVIAILTISYHVYISQIMENDDDFGFGNVSYGLSALASGIAAIYVGIKYKGSEIFGVTYTALGIGFLFLFLGDTMYNYFEYILDEDPYPSIADVFFLLYYPFVGYYLIRNIRYFKKDLSVELKLGVSALTVIIVFLFAIISFDDIEGHSFDFYFGLLFVFGSSTILSLAICGVAIFRQSLVGIAWLFLAIGIFLFTFADVWYYYLELTEEYSNDHVTNTLWIMSNIIIVYALYKHKKII